MTKARGVPLALALLLSTGALAQEGTLSARQQAREALYAADQAQSEATRRDGSRAGFAPFLADDAVMLASGTYLLRGKEAILAYLATRPLETLNRGTLWWEPLQWDASVDGLVGYSSGRLWNEQRNADGTHWKTVHGTYIATWKRDLTGAWKMAAFVRGLLGDDTGAGGPPLADLPEGCKAFHDNGRHGAREQDPAVYEAEVRGVDLAFAAYAKAQGTRAAFEAFASEDVYVGEATCGPETVNYQGPEQEWAPELVTAASTGDIAWSVGRASYVVPGADGTPVRRYSKYLTVWKRDRGGALRWIFDAGASNPGGDRL